MHTSFFIGSGRQTITLKNERPKKEDKIKGVSETDY